MTAQEAINWIVHHRATIEVSYYELKTHVSIEIPDRDTHRVHFDDKFEQYGYEPGEKIIVAVRLASQTLTPDDPKPEEAKPGDSKIKIVHHHKVPGICPPDPAVLLNEPSMDERLSKLIAETVDRTVKRARGPAIGDTGVIADGEFYNPNTGMIETRYRTTHELHEELKAKRKEVQDLTAALQARGPADAPATEPQRLDKTGEVVQDSPPGLTEAATAKPKRLLRRLGDLAERVKILEDQAENYRSWAHEAEDRLKDAQDAMTVADGWWRDILNRARLGKGVYVWRPLYEHAYKAFPWTTQLPLSPCTAEDPLAPIFEHAPAGINKMHYGTSGRRVRLEVIQSCVNRVNRVNLVLNELQINDGLPDIERTGFAAKLQEQLDAHNARLDREARSAKP